MAWQTGPLDTARLSQATPISLPGKPGRLGQAFAKRLVPAAGDTNALDRLPHVSSFDQRLERISCIVLVSDLLLFAARASSLRHDLS